MDRHVSQGAGGGAGLQEFCHAGVIVGGGGGQQEVVVDGAFLMEFLEDTPAAAEQQLQTTEDDDVVDDRLIRVMRSLEAEIGGGTEPVTDGGGDGATGVPASGDDDGRLEPEDMLSDDFNSSRGSSSTEAAPPLPFEYWAEMPPVMGHDMGGWCIDGDGVVAGYEFREPCYYTYVAESSHVEQLQAYSYSPLWNE
ncbi:hypothetical protein ABZP36_020952 [Zizania latifolia]